MAGADIEASENPTQGHPEKRPGFRMGLIFLFAALAMIGIESYQFAAEQAERAAAVAAVEARLIAAGLPLDRDTAKALGHLVSPDGAEFFVWTDHFKAAFSYMVVGAFLFQFGRSEAGCWAGQIFTKFWTWRPQ